jgi:Protein of unknown function (DUF559)
MSNKCDEFAAIRLANRSRSERPVSLFRSHRSPQLACSVRRPGLRGRECSSIIDSPLITWRRGTVTYRGKQGYIGEHPPAVKWYNLHVTEDNTEGTPQSDVKPFRKRRSDGDSVETTRPAPPSVEEFAAAYERLGSRKALAELYDVSPGIATRWLREIKAGAAQLNPVYYSKAERENFSKKMQQTWADPEQRERRMETISHPDGSAVSARLRDMYAKYGKDAPTIKHWQDPASRDRQSRMMQKKLDDAGGVFIPSGEAELREALKQASVSFFAPGIIMNGRCVVDAYLPNHMVLIEVDGKSHNDTSSRKRDILRDKDLRSHGYTIFRFTDTQMISDAGSCVMSMNLDPEESPQWTERGLHQAFGRRTAVVNGTVWADDDIVRPARNGKGAESRGNDVITRGCAW